jgi:hypothetical protein
VSASHETSYTVTENKRFIRCREMRVCILWKWHKSYKKLRGLSFALLMLTQVVWLPFVQIPQFEINECHTLCLAHIVWAFFMSPDISVCILKGHVEFGCGFSLTVARLYQISYQWEVVQVYPSLWFGLGGRNSLKNYCVFITNTSC